MKFVFAHQNFPAQYLHLVRRLARGGGHDLVFLTEPNANHLPGVRKVPYRAPPPSPAPVHRAARDHDNAMRRAEAVGRVAANLKSLGFVPDIILGHHGWGELLNLPDVWPNVPLLGYFEFFYHTERADLGFDPEFPPAPDDFPRVRAKNVTNLLALTAGGHGQTPTEWQLSTYPDWARPRISVLREGADLSVCKPDPKAARTALPIGGARIGARDKLVTYVSRDLEPYRGFHVLMRALPLLLAERKDVRVVLVGGDGVSYGSPPPKGTWRQTLLAELGDRIDPERVIFAGKVDYKLYLRLLQRSDAHVYLTYPFVASWSLREALAIGCPIIGSDTAPVREFITDGINGRLVSFFDPDGLARCILEVLENRVLAARIREGARRYAERHLSLDDTLGRYEALIARLTGTERAAAA